MRITKLAGLAAATALVAGSVAAAVPATAATTTGTTTITTGAGLSATFEAAGVVLYAQGTGTATVLGDSIAAANGQVQFKFPVTAASPTVAHTGSVLTLFNTANNRAVQLTNLTIDLANGTVIATVPQGTGQPLPAIAITNAASVKPVTVTNKKTGVTTTTVAGAQIAVAAGYGGAISTLLGLPASAVKDGTPLGTADVVITTTAPAKKKKK